MATDFRKLRRSGHVSEFISINLNVKQKTLYISSDGGRVCRPYVFLLSSPPSVT